MSPRNHPQYPGDHHQGARGSPQGTADGPQGTRGGSGATLKHPKSPCSRRVMDRDRCRGWWIAHLCLRRMLIQSPMASVLAATKLVVHLRGGTKVKELPRGATRHRGTASQVCGPLLCPQKRPPKTEPSHPLVQKVPGRAFWVLKRCNPSAANTPPPLLPPPLMYSPVPHPPGEAGTECPAPHPPGRWRTGYVQPV